MRIVSITGNDSPIVHKPLPTDDPQRRQPNITRARQLLGWQPEVSLDAGLRKTLAYFRAISNVVPHTPGSETYISAPMTEMAVNG
jgi:nucleoside-diphosphate-sugar epimerase